MADDKIVVAVAECLFLFALWRGLSSGEIVYGRFFSKRFRADRVDRPRLYWAIVAVLFLFSLDGLWALAAS